MRGGFSGKSSGVDGVALALGTGGVSGAGSLAIFLVAVLFFTVIDFVGTGTGLGIAGATSCIADTGSGVTSACCELDGNGGTGTSVAGKDCSGGDAGLCAAGKAFAICILKGGVGARRFSQGISMPGSPRPGIPNCKDSTKAWINSDTSTPISRRLVTGSGIDDSRCRGPKFMQGDGSFS